VLSQGEPRDVALNFGRYRSLQRHRVVSLPEHGFLVQAYISDRANAETDPDDGRKSQQKTIKATMIDIIVDTDNIGPYLLCLRDR